MVALSNSFRQLREELSSGLLKYNCSVFGYVSYSPTPLYCLGLDGPMSVPSHNNMFPARVQTTSINSMMVRKPSFSSINNLVSFITDSKSFYIFMGRTIFLSVNRDNQVR